MQQLNKQAKPTNKQRSHKQGNKQAHKQVSRSASKSPSKLPSIKLPPTARGAALAVLGQVLDEGAYTNLAINKYLRNHEMESMERRLFTELVYGTVKALGTIDWYLAQCVSRPLEQLDKNVLNILRLSAYQLLYLERIPAAAACNEAVKLTRCVSHEGSAKLVNGVLRGLLRKEQAGELALPDPEQDDAGYLALKYYHPRWLVKRWLGPWGKQGTEALLAFNNTSAPVCLRTNTLVTTRERLLADITELAGRTEATAAGAELEPSRWCAEGIVVRKLGTLGLGELLAKFPDSFYVQDESSMLVAGLVAPQPGMAVLDMCSAPGGKTTHLAQLMQNQGSITACDVHEHKLQLIAENAARLGISIIKPTLNDGTIERAEWLGKFDRVLVDAAGRGTLAQAAQGFKAVPAPAAANFAECCSLSEGGGQAGVQHLHH